MNYYARHLGIASTCWLRHSMFAPGTSARGFIADVQRAVNIMSGNRHWWVGFDRNQWPGRGDCDG